VKTRFVPVAALAVASLLLSACTSTEPEAPTTGGEPGEIRTVQVASLPIAETGALWAAIEEGIFEKHGLAVEVVPAQGGAQAIPALLNGDIQFAIGQPFGPFRAEIGDLGIKVLTNYASSLTEGKDVNAVVASAASGITSIKDLAGKKVSVNSLGAAGDVTIMAAVEAAGGDPSTIEFVEVAFPEVKAQLDAGNIDAGWVPEPFVSQIVGGGGTLVMHPYQETIPGLPLLLAFTSQALIDSDAQLVDDFTAAITEALEFADANPDAVRAAIKSNLEIPEAVVDGLPLPVFTAKLDKGKIEELGKLAVSVGVLPEAPDFGNLYR
jgi:NitT/TauT family transport system substrate-binding protein